MRAVAALGCAVAIAGCFEAGDVRKAASPRKPTLGSVVTLGSAADSRRMSTSGPALFVGGFVSGLRGWTVSGAPHARAAGFSGDPAIRLSALGGPPATISHRLPPRPWALSFDVRVADGGVATLRFPGSSAQVRLVGRASGVLVLSAGGGEHPIPDPAAGGPSGWHRVELVDGAQPVMAVDGQPLPAPPALGGRLAIRVRGTVELAAVIASRATDAAGLLLQRLAAIHSRVPPGSFPLGTGADGVFRFADDWNSGFWAGALWHAYDLTGHNRLFRAWALNATLAHLGRERRQIHDQGFMYGQSSVAGYDRLCSRRPPAACRLLGESGLTAAQTLLGLAASNRRAGMIPTTGPAERCEGCHPREAETILDSMMNLSLLLWAGHETGDASYARTAALHAAKVARFLVRSDGSTAQALDVLRSDGRVRRVHTNQGLSNSSTWARGQGWAVYGFAQIAKALHDPAFLAVAERTAGYVAKHLPDSGIPPWDYDAAPGDPVDTSAGVITAAGLLRLSQACASMPGKCRHEGSWRPLATRMLDASLARVSAVPPLGFLGSQVYALGGQETWDDDGEYMFGLDYALEALSLERRR